MTELTVTILGCGASSGVPVVGCDCDVCKSTNPKNKRLRVSVLVESAHGIIMIDTSPDIRQQCLANGITKIDSLIFTHAHADHLHGIDDLRTLNAGKGAPIETYTDEPTLHAIRERFGYVFLPPKPAKIGWFRPCLIPHTITPYLPFEINGLKVIPFEQKHGQGISLGLRIGNFAYSTDANGLSEEAFNVLEGVDTWVVDCLRYLEAPTHAHLEMTLGWIDRVKPRQAYLTHLNHEFDYDKLCSELPPNALPAHDGLRFKVT